MSLRIWRSCGSRLFRSSLIRGIDSFSSVLLHPHPHHRVNPIRMFLKKSHTNRTMETPAPQDPQTQKLSGMCLPLGAAEAVADAALEEGVQHRMAREGWRPASCCIPAQPPTRNTRRQKKSIRIENHANPRTATPGLSRSQHCRGAQPGAGLPQHVTSRAGAAARRVGEEE
jgi:hypothetical protein